MVREYAQLAAAMATVADWTLRDTLTAKLAARMESGKPGMFETMPLLAAMDDPALHRRMAENFATALNILSQRVQQPAPRGVGPADRRLRIGYLGGDFNQSTIALLLASVLEAHDRSKFEIFAYDYSHDDGSPIRARILAACEHVADLGSEPPTASAARIAADEIDILVDLKGFSDRTRTEMLVLRPAPVQVSFLNYPATLGGDWADYIIADRIVFPPELEPHFTEKPVRMPAAHLPGDRGRPLPAPDTDRVAQGLPETGTVFACFTNPNRITPAIFAAWMNILKATDGSVLWLFQGNEMAGANLRAHATAAGIDPSRLVFTRPATQEQHAARHACADLFLDTTPFGTGSMVADALWAGLPVITCMGQGYASRTSASLLHAAGLPELAVTDLGAYVALATQLAADPAQLMSLRGRLEAARQSSPLFDAPAFARGLEQAFITMAEIQRSGAAPAPIDVTI
jgi:predicted O-linked N-acetylglucosamine transferase (SPINDLY family)